MRLPVALLASLLCGCSAAGWDNGTPDGVDWEDGPSADDDDVTSDDDDSSASTDDDDTTAGDDDDSTDEPPPEPEALTPCAVGDCWDTGISAPPCSSATVAEDFSTGLYNVHGYATSMLGGWGLDLGLEVTGGPWDPILVVATSVGEVLSDGTVGLIDPTRGIEVTIASDGSGGPASVSIVSDVDLDLVVFVTGWHVVEGGFAPAMPSDSTYTLTATSDCPDDAGLYAPVGAMTDEFDVDAGTWTLPIGSSWGAPGRIDSLPGEYIGYRLDFSPAGATVDLQVLVWDGAAAVALGTTDGGSGLRFLAARDPDIGRTFYVRAQGTVSTGTLTVTRTPLSESPPCSADCGDLLQLPLPVAPAAQGYDMGPGVVYRYQFGRRDLLETLLYTGRQLAASGRQGFTAKDLSQWDGSRPPGHETHNDGWHADLSLFDASGDPVWAALCANNGEYCTGGASNFGAADMAFYLGVLFETDVISSIYLDDVLIAEVEDAADAMLTAGELDPTVHAIMLSDALRHIDYHHHHIHVRADGLCLPVGAARDVDAPEGPVDRAHTSWDNKVLAGTTVGRLSSKASRST